MKLTDILKAMVQLKASDLFLKVGTPPAVRVDGHVRQLGQVALTRENLKEYLPQLVDDFSRELFRKNHEVDTAY